MKGLIALSIYFAFVGVAIAEDEPNSFLQSLQKHTWEAGPEIYYFYYEELALGWFTIMEEEGLMYGVDGAYTYRGWVPAALKEQEPSGKWMFRGEGRFAWGEVDYSNSGTIDNIDDFTYELRGLLGADFLKTTAVETIYAGIGYRYLNDDSSGMTSSTGARGYERESNYLYLPIGLATTGGLKDGWSLRGTAEFDLLLTGLQKTHLSDAGLGYGDIENRQDSGYGFRFSIGFQKKGKKTDFIIEPFLRYWWIDESDVEYSAGTAFVEPENETIEFGISLIWRF